MEKKYKLTDETILCNGHTLHRIKALKDFSHVKKGYLGGFIEKEDNLSQLGDCWVYDDAKVFGNAKVYGNAEICGGAMIYDNAIISDARVYDNAKIHGFAGVSDNAEIYGEAEIYGNAYVFGNAEVCGNTQVSDDAYVFDSAKVGGDAHIGGNAWIYGKADIIGDAQIKSIDDYAVFKNFWSSGRYFTWTKSNNMWKVGCFYGTGEELIKKAYKDSDESGKKYEATVNYIKSIFN